MLMAHRKASTHMLNIVGLPGLLYSTKELRKKCAPNSASMRSMSKIKACTQQSSLCYVEIILAYLSITKTVPRLCLGCHDLWRARC